MSRRLSLRIQRCFWSTKPQKTLTLTGLAFLGTLLLWTLTSEVLAYKITSLSWGWPKPYPDSQALDNSYLSRKYLVIDGIHQFVLGSHEPGVVGGTSSSYRYRNRDSKVNHHLRLLILSDPHIMCTHNKYVSLI